MRLLLLTAVLCAIALPTHAETVANIESPDKTLRVELDLTEGRLGYRVSRLGQPVINTSRLGFLLHDAEKIERNLALTDRHTRRFDETWEQP